MTISLSTVVSKKNYIHDINYLFYEIVLVIPIIAPNCTRSSWYKGGYLFIMLISSKHLITVYKGAFKGITFNTKPKFNMVSPEMLLIFI